MRPARIIAAVLLAAAVAATGSYLAFSTAANPSAAPQPPGTAPPLSDPQVAADRLVAAWVGGDRTAARNLTSQAVTDRLFSESPPAHLPAALPCRLVPNLAVFVCSYAIAEGAELSIFVEGGASAGYGVSGVEFAAAIAVPGGTAPSRTDQPTPAPPGPDTTHAFKAPTHRPDPTQLNPVDRQTPIYAAVRART